jgi:copper chaperone CopZ
MAHYIHHVPGRLRVRTPLLKRDERRAAEAEQLVQEIYGVTAAKANTVTGSLVVNYQRDVVSAEAILNTLALLGYYEPQAVQDADGQIHDLASRAGSTVGKVLFGFVVEKAVERSALALIGALL